jgi:hypothetical protein
MCHYMLDCTGEFLGIKNKLKYVHMNVHPNGFPLKVSDFPRAICLCRVIAEDQLTPNNVFTFTLPATLSMNTLVVLQCQSLGKHAAHRSSMETGYSLI